MGSSQNNFQITGSTGVSVSGVKQVITVGETEPEPETERIVKVLFLGANPTGTEQLRLDRGALQEELEHRLEAWQRGRA